METKISINHIGLTVTNIEEAVAWYQKLFNFELIIGPLPLTNDDTHFGQLSKDIFGDDFEGGHFAHLRASNGVGIELFSFDREDAGENYRMDYWKNGIFHLCLTHPNPEELAAEITANGGKQRTKNWTIFPGSDRKLVYCEDPWGNIIEVYSHAYQETWNYLLQEA